MRENVMRASALLVVLGILLIGFQVGFSDGTEPNILPLAIGMWPVTAGLAALLAGLCVGLAGGTMRYRLAVMLGMVGTLSAAFGLLLIYSRDPSVPPPILTINDAALILGGLLWLLAIGLGVSELRHAGGRVTAPTRDIRER